MINGKNDEQALPEIPQIGIDILLSYINEYLLGNYPPARLSRCSTEIFANREDLFIKCESILQEMMQSQNATISKSISTEIFDIVKKCVSIEELSKPKTGTERKIKFLLRSNIFKCLILYGLYSKSTEVSVMTCLAEIISPS